MANARIRKKGRKKPGEAEENAVIHIIHNRLIPALWKTERPDFRGFAGKQNQYMLYFSTVCPGIIHNLQIYIDEKENSMI